MIIMTELKFKFCKKKTVIQEMICFFFQFSKFCTDLQFFYVFLFFFDFQQGKIY